MPTQYATSHPSHLSICDDKDVSLGDLETWYAWLERRKQWPFSQSEPAKDMYEAGQIVDRRNLAENVGGMTMSLTRLSYAADKTIRWGEAG